MSCCKFLNPRNDFAFKQVFGIERNKDILLHFLNDIFANVMPPIEEVKLLPTNYDKERETGRSSIVDILCTDQRGHRFIVEMQVVHAKGFLQRIQYYASRAYVTQRTAQHQRGEKRIEAVDYDGLCPITVLAITNFVLFPNDEPFLSHHKTLNIATQENNLKALSYSFLELPKFTNTIDQLGSMLDKWAYFLKYAQETREEELAAIIGNDLILKKAYAELDRFHWTDEELQYYDGVEMKIGHDIGALALAEERGLEKGLEKGREEGRQALLNSAEKPLLRGIPRQEVAALLGLLQSELPSV